MYINALLDLNWIAIALGAFAHFVLGAIWTSRIGFERVWLRSQGLAGNPTYTASYYVTPLLGSVVASVFVGVMLAIFDVADPGVALAVGIGVGAVAASTSMTNAITPRFPQPLVFGAIVGGYHLVGSVVVAGVQGAFL